MKRIRINAGKIGLEFRNGDYKRVLPAGKYWVNPFSTILIYFDSVAFQPPISLDILLRDEKLKEMLNVVEVKDGEIALQYEAGNFQTVLTPGRYAFWKSLTKVVFRVVNTENVEIETGIDLSTLKRKELIPFVQVCNVGNFEKAVLFIDNKMERILNPGTYYFWKSTREVSVAKTDLRQLQMEVSGQEILTKDKAALRINFFSQYKVVNIEKALIENKEYEKQLYILMQFALRAYIGTLTLDELLENKESIAEFVMRELKEKAAKLGVEIKDCGVRDIILPGEMKEIMNQVLVAQKQAQANVINRREESASTRSLLNTAKLMEENEMLFKLKEMEYVEKIAEKIGEITVSGNGQVLEQLKSVFSTGK